MSSRFLRTIWRSTLMFGAVLAAYSPAWSESRANHVHRFPTGLLVDLAGALRPGSSCDGKQRVNVDRDYVRPASQIENLAWTVGAPGEPTSNPAITKLRAPPGAQISTNVYRLSPQVATHFGGEDIILGHTDLFAQVRIQATKKLAMYYILPYECFFSDGDTVISASLSYVRRYFPEE